MILREDSTEAARRSADHGDWTVAEHARGVRVGPREPIDGVLEHARDSVVVFGGHQQQAIGRDNTVLEFLDGGGQSLGSLDIGIVERNAMNRRYFKPRVAFHKTRGGAQQGGIKRFLPEAAGNA